MTPVYFTSHYCTSYASWPGDEATQAPAPNSLYSKSAFAMQCVGVSESYDTLVRS